MADPKTVTVSPDDAIAFVEAILQGAGVSKANAETIAHGLVSADLRGVESHGINRIPSYLARVRSGILDPKAEPTLNQITPVVAQVRAIPLDHLYSFLCFSLDFHSLRCVDSYQQ